MTKKEIEFKFKMNRRLLAKLLAHILLQRHLSGKKSLSLRTIYFDTSDYVLREQGIALRMRKLPDGGFLQGVKRRVKDEQAAAGLYKNLEWEREVGAPEIHIELMPKFIQEKLRNLSLKPLFETIFHREAWQLQFEAFTAEMVFDEGSIQVCGDSKKQKRFRELEIELKKGDIMALEKLVKALQKDLSLAPEMQTKSQRGYLLCGVS